MAHRLARLRAPVAGLLAFSASLNALALDADDARRQAQQSVQSVRAEITSLSASLEAAARAAHAAEELIAAGELSLRTKDYELAIDTFNQVIELFRQGKASVNVHADGLFLLGEAYFEAGQLLSARRQYWELLSLGERSPYDSYAGRALARLVDVALHTGHLESLPAVGAQAARLSARDSTGSFEYARGKLSFAQGDYAAARAVFEGVRPDSAYYHQSQYVIGTMLLKQALAGAGDNPEAQARLVVPGAAERFAPVIEQFRRVAALPADSAVHRQIIDLAWLAIGRLYYESENYLEAAEAYIRVDRASPAYYDMLYELAWVYVRVGDYQRAERALELLSVAAPDTLDVADSALLRADLMLRSGRFERALEAYKEVHARFDPARAQLATFLEETRDPATYYDRLVEEGLAVGIPSKIPEVVLNWVREEARGDRVFAVIEDVTHARDVLRRSRRLSSKLNAVLAAPSRARAFPELKAGLERTEGLVNQLTIARRTIALGLDDLEEVAYMGELGEVRTERRRLMGRVGNVPISAVDFSRREEQGTRRWNLVSQALQRVTLEADKLQAIINGLERVLSEADQHGVTSNPAARERFKAELQANEQDLAVYRTRIEAYRRDVEAGRVQVGYGDRRYAQDRAVRDRFRDLLEREVALLAASPSEETVAYARAVQPLLGDARIAEEQLGTVIADLEAKVSAGSDRLRQLVEEETQRIELFTQRLDALDQHARLLVGEVAMRNFETVRDRLKGIVLRADVGVVQQAWELREEQQTRLRALQRQRALEEQNLDDELREVFDDAGEAL